jgi:hypothetical protein
MQTLPPSIAPQTMQLLRLAEVPKLLKKLSGLDRNRKTIYNWANKGKTNYSGEHIVLRTISKAGVKFTTRAWVNKFLVELER